ncbi:ABC transporter permease [Streptomyces pratensis]|uniref:ABC transporter permease n=1 Tax=Streptomyces pratensis TaxID=1169025 RepID=UPI003016A52F
MFFTYLRRELRRRRKSALVVASGLALGIALVIVVNAVSTGMGKAQEHVLESLYGLGTDMTVTKAPEPPSEAGGERPRFRFDAGDDEGGERQSSDRVMVQGLQTLDAATVSSVAKADGVADAVGGLSLNVVKVDGEFSRGQFQQRPGAGRGGGSDGEVTGGGADFSIDSFTVYGTDVAHPGMGPLSSSEITDGRGFETSETSAKAAVVDNAYAKEKKLTTGDTVTVSDTEFEIIGVATATSGEAAANVYLPLAQAQTLADAKDKITTVYVQANDTQQLGTVESAVLKAVPDATVTTSEDLADTVSGSLSTASGLAETVGRWLSVVVLTAAFLVAGLLTSSAVARRVREFGTLKALGWRSRRVTGQVVGEAVVTGLVGGAMGIGLGLAGAWAVTAFGPSLSAELGASGGGASGPGGAMGGPGGGMGGGRGGAARETAERTLDVVLTAPVSVSVIVLAVGLAVAGGLVAGAFGGWRASRLRPADALSRVA